MIFISLHKDFVPVKGRTISGHEIQPMLLAENHLRFFS